MILVELAKFYFLFIFYQKHYMGIQNRDGALYFATGIDNTGLYSGRREAMGIIKAMAGEITSFDVFGGIGISAGIAFAQAAKGAYDFEKQFQHSMKEVATLSSGIKGSLTDYMNQVVELTREVPVLANDAAKALYQIVSAGHDGAAGMKVLEVSAKAAVGGVTETATAADGITTLLNAYKLDVSQAENISDQLFTTVRLGKTSFGELAKSIAQVAPIAASYGVETEQVLAAVATLTKQGTPTAQAMTQIRASIIAVSKVLGDGAFDNRTYQEALAEVARQAGGSESKLRELIPEIEAVNAVLGLTGINVQEAAGHLGEMQNATGAAEAAFKEMASAAENQLKLLGNNVTAALRPLGEELLQKVSSIATAFNKAFENGDVQQSLQTLGGLIVTITSAFVGYKGAMIALNTVKKINASLLEIERYEMTLYRKAVEAGTISENVLTSAQVKNMATRKAMIATIKLHTATLGRNVAALATNPYILAAAAVAGLGYAIYEIVTAETAAEIIQRKYNKVIEEQNRQLDELKNKTNSLVSIVKDENSTQYDKVKAYKQLQALMPTVFANMDIEKLKLMDQLSLNKQINAEKNKQERIIAKTNLVLAQKKYDTASAKYKEDTDDGLVGAGSLVAKNEAFLELEVAKKVVADIENIQKEVDSKSKPKELKIVSLQSNIDTLKAEISELKLLVEKEQEENNGWSPNAWLLKAKKGQLTTKEKEMKSLQGNGNNKKIETKTDEAYWKKQKEEAEKALKALSDVEAAGKKGMVLKEKIAIIDKKLDTFYTNSSKQESAADTLRKEQEKYKLLLDQQKREAARMKTDSQHELEQIEIDGLKEGSEKVLRQRALNHVKELEAIKREAEDKKLKEIEAARSAFEANPANAKNTFDVKKDFTDLQSTKDLFASFDKIAEAKTKTENIKYNRGDDLKGLLDEYQDYTDKRLAIETKYNNDLATLEEQRKQAVKHGDTKQVEQIDRAKAQVTKNKGMGLMGMDYDKLKESPEYVRAFENLKETSSETLNSLLSQLENAKTAAAQVLSPDQLREYTTTIQEIMDELDARNPFQALADRKKELAEAEEELAEAKSNLDKVNSGGKVASGTKLNEKTGKIDTTYLSATQALEKYNKAKDKSVEADAKVKKAEKDVKGQIDELSNAIGELGSAVGGQAGEIISLIGEIGSFAMMAMSGVETASKTASTAIQTVEKASVILAIIGAAIQIATKIAKLFSGDDEEKRKKYTEHLNGIIDIYDKIIEKQKESIKFGYGFSSIVAAKKAMEDLNKQTEQYRKIASVNPSIVGGDNAKQYMQVMKEFGIDVQESFFGKVQTQQLYKLSSKQLEYIRDNYKDLWASLKDEQREALQAIIDSEEKGKEIIDAWQEAITGISYDSFYLEFIDTLSDMDSSAADMAENFGDYLRKSILAAMIAKNFQKDIDGLYDMWAAAGDGKSDGGIEITEDEAKELQRKYMELVEAMTKKREEMEESYGFSSSDSESSSQDSTKGGFEAMSQDTGTELNGRFTAFQISNEEVKNQTIVQTGIQQEIARKIEFLYNFNYSTFSEMRDIMWDVLDTILDIKKDTAHLYFIRESLNKIDNNTKGLASK